MLEVLYEAERLLPELLASDDGWQGLHADTEKPYLTRIWRQWGENRINLHMFSGYSTADIFPHPHEWDSAIRVLEEDCEMGLGWGIDPATPPEDFFRVVLKPGSAYQMVGRNGWHWVRPVSGHGYCSLMVSGPPRYRENRVRVNSVTRILTPMEIGYMRLRFGAFYPR